MRLVTLFLLIGLCINHVVYSQCPDVSNISSVSQEPGVIDITWTENGTATLWHVNVYKSGTTEKIIPLSIVSHSPQLTIYPGSCLDYVDVSIKSICTIGSSNEILASNLSTDAANFNSVYDPSLLNAMLTSNCVSITSPQIGPLINPDLNGDGVLSTTEAHSIKRLELTNNSKTILCTKGIEQFVNLEILELENNVIENINLTTLSKLKDLTIKNNPLTSIDLSQNVFLTRLTLTNIPLTSIDVSNNVNLNFFSLSVDYTTQNSFVNIDLSTLVKLEYLLLRRMNLGNIDLSNNVLIDSLSLNEVGLTAVDISMLTNLKSLSVPYNPMTNIDVSSNLQLISLSGYSTSLTSIDVSLNTELAVLRLPFNQLSSIDVSNNDKLEFIVLEGNFLIDQLDLSNLSDLTYLNIEDLRLTELDLSNNPLINYINAEDMLYLEYINLKNGANNLTTLNMDLPVDLKHVCVDNEAESLHVASLLQNQGITNIPINSYCSFIAGGTNHFINGAARYDVGGNGCNITDPAYPNLFFNITNGIINGALSSNSLGEFSIPVSDGSHTITPNPENPSYWSFTPASAVVSFPTQSSPVTQDFCITSVGVAEDLEVVVLPLGQARPGFDADYKVVVRNKGNQTVSGTVTLDFEENFMTLHSSNPTAVNNPSNQLSWSFSSLHPFQMEDFLFRMNLNSPTVNLNPLNSGDTVTFTGTVSGTGTDVNPADNSIVFNQTVVNSYDPNDKTCLEGEFITPNNVGEYVHYLIRFENTGTASAINVVVKDEINLNQFDISTLIPLGGSHDYYTRIRDGNVVEFIHENINLDYNDSSNSGYVLFKIKTLNTLQEGDTFDNTAEIYFDFNFPIITNTEVVYVMSTATLVETIDDTIQLYPNPAKTFIHLTASNRLEFVSIMDLNGRILSQTNFIGNDISQQISISNLTSGIYFVNVKTDAGQKVEKLIVN